MTYETKEYTKDQIIEALQKYIGIKEFYAQIIPDRDMYDSLYIKVYAKYGNKETYLDLDELFPTGAWGYQVLNINYDKPWWKRNRCISTIKVKWSLL